MKRLCNSAILIAMAIFISLTCCEYALAEVEAEFYGVVFMRKPSMIHEEWGNRTVSLSLAYEYELSIRIENTGHDNILPDDNVVITLASLGPSGSVNQRWQHGLEEPRRSPSRRSCLPEAVR